MARLWIARSIGMFLLATLVGRPPAEAQAAKDGGLLSPNLATREQLLALPNLDAALVDAIVKGRPHPDMSAVDRLVAAKLSPEQRRELYGRLFEPLNLNKATREEILLIPGVGRRMANEFEEYRPYRSLEQFRREIGKYVSREELARLERYVTIK